VRPLTKLEQLEYRIEFLREQRRKDELKDAWLEFSKQVSRIIGSEKE